MSGSAPLIAATPIYTARIRGYPSVELYKDFKRALYFAYPGFQWMESLVKTHNHYTVVLRECRDDHALEEECIQMLYVSCPLICYEHYVAPVSQGRMQTFLKGYLGL